jgi:hypothetical protein
VTDATVHQMEYVGPDCQGGGSVQGVYTSSNYIINCGFNNVKDKNCGVTLTSYDTNEGLCNYEDSLYRAPNPRSSCKYIVIGHDPYAIGVCVSGRQGFHTYSSKYACNEDTGNVELWSWLESDSCEGTDNKYLQSTFTNTTHTFQCDGSVCENKIRTFDDCENSGNEYKDEYTETAYLWNECLPYYDNPQSRQNGSIYSYQEILYKMNTCVDGYRAVFYYTDSECTDANTFYIYNTTDSGTCDSEITGCSNSNDQFPLSSGSILSTHYYVIACLFSMLMYLW